MNAPTDDNLIRQIVQSLGLARAAFGQLYEAHATRLLYFIQARVGEAAAEDLHHDVWLRIWDALPRQFHGGNFRAWLYEIARNLCYDHGRRHQPGLEPFQDGEKLPDEWNRPGPGQVPPGQFQEERLTRALRACMQQLEREDSQAAAVVRGISGGRPYVDLCQELNLKPERAHRIYHEARKQLRKCVEQSQP